MKRLFTIILALGCLATMSAKEHGIEFRHDLKWQQALEEARKSGRLVFVDFYTQWCGPCYNMAKTVFTLPDVAYFYNNNFINLKIDCEEPEEGVELARKYGVRSFPTYGFIDPATAVRAPNGSYAQARMPSTPRCARSDSTRSTRAATVRANFSPTTSDITPRFTSRRKSAKRLTNSSLQGPGCPTPTCGRCLMSTSRVSPPI